MTECKDNEQIQQAEDKLFNFRPLLFASIALVFGIYFAFLIKIKGVSAWWLLCLLPVLGAPFCFCRSKKRLIKTAIGICALIISFAIGGGMCSAKVNSYTDTPTYNGEYVITIEQGAYGNSIWFDNNEYGRSNAAAEIRFTLVDGRDRDIFTIEAESVTPVSGTYQKAEDLATVTVTFPNGDTKLVNGAYATLGGLDSDYLQQATFTATATPGVYTATFPTLPTSNGKYRLSVAAGSFGNEAFISSNGTSGAGSKAIQEDYDLSLNNGIAGIAADAAEYGVYSVTGVYMGTEVENLPAGIYVINGKKIIVK